MESGGPAWTASMDSQPLLSVDDLARLLRISRRSVFAMLAGGTAPRSMRIGGLRRFRRETVERWLAEKEAHSDAAPRSSQTE